VSEEVELLEVSGRQKRACNSCNSEYALHSVLAFQGQEEAGEMRSVLMTDTMRGVGERVEERRVGGGGEEEDEDDKEEAKEEAEEEAGAR
jgi:hypothetical protein